MSRSRFAEKIKGLNIDGESVTIACAGVSTEDSDRPDERLLRDRFPGVLRAHRQCSDVERLPRRGGQFGSIVSA